MNDIISSKINAYKSTKRIPSSFNHKYDQFRFANKSDKSDKSDNYIETKTNPDENIYKGFVFTFISKYFGNYSTLKTNTNNRKKSFNTSINNFNCDYYNNNNGCDYVYGDCDDNYDRSVFNYESLRKFNPNKKKLYRNISSSDQGLTSKSNSTSTSTSMPTLITSFFKKYESNQNTFESKFKYGGYLPSFLIISEYLNNREKQLRDREKQLRDRETKLINYEHELRNREIALQNRENELNLHKSKLDSM
jgi:hypothetical protein